MGIPKFNQRQIPKTGGLSTDHVAGMSGRKGKYSMGSGTNLKLHGGNQAKRQQGGVGQSTAPYKHNATTFSVAPKLFEP